jgi:glycosidase
MRIKSVIFFLLIAVCGKAQLLSWSPDFVQETSTPVVITCDATKGNQGLLNYTPTSDVYVHLGVITNLSTGPSNWLHVPSFCVWGTTNVQANCTYLGNNKWSYSITGGLRNFFGLTNPAEKILRIAILFRNGSGAKAQRNADASDMYVPVYDNGEYARIDTPLRMPTYTLGNEVINKNVGDYISINAKASQSSTLKVYFNNNVIATANSATTLSTSTNITVTGTQTIIAEANNGTTTARDTISFLVTGGNNIAPLPTGVSDGINYESGDTSVTLVLYAPNKGKVIVIGDFNNWTQTATYQMNETPDLSRFWLRIKGLTPGTEYAYQYVIDNTITVADYNTEKVLDPSNDPYIPATTYPNLKAYPTGKTTGIVGIFQTAKPAYTWQTTSFTRPPKSTLMIYELLVRDFTAAENWQTLKDTLTYLKRLGVNAIEVMPFNEFEGNNSWGYNPNFNFAPDKYYGTENAIRQFIDQCHSMGIAVIMDIVMNHAMGSSPLAQMYWDAANSIPAANSPWFNQYPTHPYNVGNDFNHESQATKDLVARIVRHWLTKYKIDGFRWDLSKGFTQTYSGSNVSLWGNYDQSRINIWERIYDTIQQVSPGAYCILEHFADNSEETVLSNYGMMLWGNMNYNFNQASMGYSSGWDFSYGVFTNRGWTNPNLVTYQESHDEERLMYKNEQYGNVSGSYAITSIPTGLKREEMNAAFWAMIPGPKMMWEFGELGYDYSINTCSDGVTINNNCRTDPKPVRWDYYQDANRKALYTVYSKLIRLKVNSNYTTAFSSSNVTWNFANGFKWMLVNDASLKVMVIGNFDVTAQTGSVTFPTAGTWYSFLTGTTRVATGGAENITLQPGEYYVYTNINAANVVLALPTGGSGNTPARRDSSGYVDGIKITAFPNPISANGTIEYSLLTGGQLDLSITDASGVRVATLFNGYRARGTYNVSANTNNLIARLSSGMYFIEAKLDDKRRTTKLIVAK